jgi:hypothetical protein
MHAPTFNKWHKKKKEKKIKRRLRANKVKRATKDVISALKNGCG